MDVHSVPPRTGTSDHSEGCKGCSSSINAEPQTVWSVMRRQWGFRCCMLKFIIMWKKSLSQDVRNHLPLLATVSAPLFPRPPVQYSQDHRDRSCSGPDLWPSGPWCSGLWVYGTVCTSVMSVSVSETYVISRASSQSEGSSSKVNSFALSFEVAELSLRFTVLAAAWSSTWVWGQTLTFDTALLGISCISHTLWKYSLRYDLSVCPFVHESYLRGSDWGYMQAYYWVDTMFGM